MSADFERILLLGAYGFLGSNLMKYIDDNSLNYKIVAFDRLDKHPANLSFDCVEASYVGDFADELLLDGIFSRCRIDLVIHCISTTIPVGGQSARYDVESNLLPTIKLLDVMVKHQCQRIVFVSSGGAVYGEGRSAHSENDPVYPKSSYGVVKVAIEKCMFQYAYGKGIKPLVLRLSNPYGKYHYSMRQGVVNVALEQARRGEVFVVYGDGSATKDYVFVEDFCKGLFELVEKEVWLQVINFGSGYLYSVNEILEEIKNQYPNFKWRYDRANKNDVSFFALDITKLRGYLDYHPRCLEEVMADLASNPL
jgi:UDP-glucose 4-epimerase